MPAVVHARDIASFLMPQSRGAVVPRLGLASELVRLGLISVWHSEGLGLGLASAWIVSASFSASVSGFKVSISPQSRLKRAHAHPWHMHTNSISCFAVICLIRCIVVCRQLCLLLNAEDVYSCCSEILIAENDVMFASHMIQTLSTILLTSSELFELRTQLKELNTEVVWFSCQIYVVRMCHQMTAVLKTNE